MAFFICSAVYSTTATSCATSPVSAAPRAWPSSNVLCGLTLTNTISTAAQSGWKRCTISAMPSKMTFSRAGSAPPSMLSVAIVPLTT